MKARSKARARNARPDEDLSEAYGLIGLYAVGATVAAFYTVPDNGWLIGLLKAGAWPIYVFVGLFIFFQELAGLFEQLLRS